MEFSVISLSIIIIAQLVERYLYAKEMNKQLGDAVRAVMSRNINEFITATTIDKTINKKPIQTDEVEISDLSDEEFDKSIKNINK